MTGLYTYYSTSNEAKHADDLVQLLHRLNHPDILEEAPTTKSHALAEQVLDAIYELGKHQSSVKFEDRNDDDVEELLEGANDIGKLLVGAIEPIKYYIENALYKYTANFDIGMLKNRSSLQFLIDHYGSFPVGKSTLSTKLKEANIKDTIKALDSIIASFDDSSSDSDEGTLYPDTKGVPKSHTWWP